MLIKIAIAEDHPIVIEGLKTVLSAHARFSVMANYATGTSLLEGLKQHQPDVLLLDIHLPDLTGNQLVRLIEPVYPSMRIIALTSNDSIADVKDMMGHGCSGYLLKNVSMPVLVEAIERVYEGGQYLDPVLQEELNQSLLFPINQQQVLQKLTQREQKILELVAAGKTNQEIATILFLSYRTIQNNRLSLYQKFNVHNTAELIKLALQLKLIQ